MSLPTKRDELNTAARFEDMAKGMPETEPEMRRFYEMLAAQARRRAETAPE